MMKEIVPPPVSGIDFESAYQNRMRRATMQFRLRPGPGYRVKQFAGGTALELIPRGGGRGAAASIAVFQYASDQPTPMYGDYVLAYAQKADGTFDRSAPINVAKPYRLRNSILNTSVGTTVYTYVYDATTVLRTATWSVAGVMYSEAQVVVEPWQAQEVLLATKISNTGVLVNGSDVGWIDLNNAARAWMRKGSLP